MPKDEGTRGTGRLAMRHEGEWWIAYYAVPDSMEGALEMGRIAMALVQDKPRKDAFMGLMRECMADILEDATGERPKFWDTQPAPQSERSGHS